MQKQLILLIFCVLIFSGCVKNQNESAVTYPSGLTIETPFNQDFYFFPSDSQIWDRESDCNKTIFIEAFDGKIEHVLTPEKKEKTTIIKTENGFEEKKEIKYYYEETAIRRKAIANNEVERHTYDIYDRFNLTEKDIEKEKLFFDFNGKWKAIIIDSNNQKKVIYEKGMFFDSLMPMNSIAFNCEVN